METIPPIPLQMKFLTILCVGAFSLFTLNKTVFGHDDCCKNGDENGCENKEGDEIIKGEEIPKVNLTQEEIEQCQEYSVQEFLVMIEKHDPIFYKCMPHISDEKFELLLAEATRQSEAKVDAGADAKVPSDDQTSEQSSDEKSDREEL